MDTVVKYSKIGKLTWIFFSWKKNTVIYDLKLRIRHGIIISGKMDVVIN